jgi:hypothetical protein
MGHDPKGGAAKALAPYLDRDRSTCMSCPKCGGATRVIDSREGPDNSIRRRRGCCTSTCLERMTTYEVIVNNAPVVDLDQLAGEQAADIVNAAALLSRLDK